MTERNIERVVHAHRQLEGAGFIVRRPFPSPRFDAADPFLLLDELGPIDYRPGEATGAPDHPHRGFETVTYVLEGETEHEDSAGHRGTLGAGDVQWMTAGRGVVHSEMPSSRLQREGGRVHGFQIWVNLPAKDKLTAPRYQEIKAAAIPEAKSADGKVTVKVVAGEALGAHAVIETRTPISYLHFKLEPGGRHMQPVPVEHRAYVYVFRGSLRIAGEVLEEGSLAVLGPGEGVALEASLSNGAPVEALLLSGVPLREPVARYGPFVMNTPAEIREAILDYQAGRMGEIRR